METENKLIKENTIWLKQRKNERIVKIISAILLAAVSLRLNDLFFLLVFFYAAALIGLVTVLVELRKRRKKNAE